MFQLFSMVLNGSVSSAEMAVMSFITQTCTNVICILIKGSGTDPVDNLAIVLQCSRNSLSKQSSELYLQQCFC